MKSKKKIIIAVVLVVLIAVGAIVGVKFGLSQKSSNSDVATEGGTSTIDGQILAKRDLSESVYVTGTVESQNVLAVTTELQAQIETLNVNVGDKVKEGDELVTFNKEEIERQIEELNNSKVQANEYAAQEKAEAERELQSVQEEYARSIAEAQSEVEESQKTYNAAQKAYDKAKKNGKKTAEELALLKQERDEAKAELKNAKSVLSQEQSSAASAIQAAQEAIKRLDTNPSVDTEDSQQLEELQSQLDKTVITAGQSGIITQLAVSRGDITSTGALMQIEDDENLRIKVPIREKDILKLEEGMTAVITSDAMPDKQVGGKVSQVINFTTESGADFYGGDGDNESNGGYSAYIDVDKDSGLLLGMSVKVEITLDSAGEKIAVPYDAILDDDSPYIYRAVPGNGDNYTIERVNVERGSSNDYYTEIISSDISEGDVIVTMPWMVSEGDTVPINIVDNAEINYEDTSDTEEDAEMTEDMEEEF